MPPIGYIATVKEVTQDGADSVGRMSIEFDGLDDMPIASIGAQEATFLGSLGDDFEFADEEEYVATDQISLSTFNKPYIFIT